MMVSPPSDPYLPCQQPAPLSKHNPLCLLLGRCSQKSFWGKFKDRQCCRGGRDNLEKQLCMLSETLWLGGGLRLWWGRPVLKAAMARFHGGPLSSPESSNFTEISQGVCAHEQSSLVPLDAFKIVSSASSKFHGGDIKHPTKTDLPQPLGPQCLLDLIETFEA